MSDWGSIDAPTEAEVEYAHKKAAEIIAAAFPELFTDPPQVWLAPVHVTEAMWPALQAEIFFERTPEEAWAASRDTHLASQSNKQEGDAK